MRSGLKVTHIFEPKSTEDNSVRIRKENICRKRIV